MGAFKFRRGRRQPDPIEGSGLRYVESQIRDLPSGAGQLVDVYGLDPATARNPDLLWCDCCLSKVDRLWFYGHPAFSVWRDRVMFNSGYWALCVSCRAIYEAGEIDTLIARSVVLDPARDVSQLSRLFSLLPRLLSKTWEAVWEAGQPIPRCERDDWAKGK